ncbi:unnamed protein product [Leuciscus chuanchicus]
MWHCYGLLLAQIWQTGVAHPSAVSPRCMWARSSFHVCQMWAGSGPTQCCYVGKPSCLNDYRPVALTSIVMKIFERHVKSHICSSIPVTLDPLHRPNRSTDDAISLVLHSSLTHMNSKNGNYVRMLFIDYSSAFNTIGIKLASKLTDIGLNSSLCDWIQDFLTCRPQVVNVGQFTSNSITLNVGAPQGCVLSPLLYSLYTHDCVSSHNSTSIIKFADDTVVLDLISNNDETAYLDEVERLTSWCQENCLSLIMDFRKRQQQPYTPLMISGTPVERGDVQGKDADASLTAFVVIAMQEGREICAGSVGSLHESIRRAVAFLEGRLPQLTNPYAVAMTSYATANAEKLNKDILMKHSTQGEAGRSWTVAGQHHHSMEATAYAVLALVKDKDFDKAGEAVFWLRSKQSHYGGSGTTQATIMVFQAVAEYRTQVKDQQNFNLDVELSVAGKRPVRFTIKRDNAHLTRSYKVEINKDFNVTARGTGTATLSVLTLYYARTVEKKSDCTLFDLTVKMEKDSETKPRAIASYNFIMDFIYKNDKTDATMTILDIGIPTGFDVEENDLKELSTGKERYIQKYEKNKVLSERGSLILYLDKVSHKETQRLSFRMHKMFNVGLLQPAAVTIYEYYSPDARCTKFYHPERTDGAIYRLCKGDMCQCAEVYKVSVDKMDLAQDSDIYHLKVEQVLKEGTDDDVEGKVRPFLGRPGCRESLGLEQGKSYLIIGKSTDLPRLGGTLHYIFEEHTWVEYWPTREESQTGEYRDQYIGISALQDSLLRDGCAP